jgi:crossover junction endodeoxyribonuclease RusA
MLPFEFVIEGPPVSQQTRRRARLRSWVAEVRRRAREEWPTGALPATGSIKVTVTYLYDVDARDVDNLAKPILDALKDLVFVDDDQVTDLIARKRNLANELRVENPSPVLAAGLDLGVQFLHVLIEQASDQELLA